MSVLSLEAVIADEAERMLLQKQAREECQPCSPCNIHDPKMCESKKFDPYWSTLEQRQESLRRIDALDLSIVKQKLSQPKERSGGGFTVAQVEQMESHYKTFLKYCVEGLDKKPGKLADEIWHAHILFTQKYHEDCQHIFGFYLHHIPDVKGADCCCGRNCSGGCGCGGSRKTV